MERSYLYPSVYLGYLYAKEALCYNPLLQSQRKAYHTAAARST